MKTPRRKFRTVPGAVGRKISPPKGKRQFITPAEARRRAERHVLNRMFKGAIVRDGAAVRLGVYSGGNRTEVFWVVYKNSDEAVLKPSEVVLVCKRTGRVLYEGSAGDEG